MIVELIRELTDAADKGVVVKAVSVNETNAWNCEYHFVCEYYRDQFVIVYMKVLRTPKAEAPSYLMDTSTDYKNGYTYSGFIDTMTGTWYEGYYILKDLEPDYDGSKTISIAALNEENKTAYLSILVNKFLKKRKTAKKRPKSDFDMDLIYSRILQGIDIPNWTLLDEVLKANRHVKEQDFFEYLLSPNTYLDQLAEESLVDSGWLETKYDMIQQLQEEYKKLVKLRTHPIWFKVAMIHSLPKEAKKVQVTFKINNCAITESLKTEVFLERSLILNEANIPEKVKSIMKALLGPDHAKALKYSAITQISYKGKVIYDKELFLQSANSNMGE